MGYPDLKNVFAVGYGLTLALALLGIVDASVMRQRSALHKLGIIDATPQRRPSDPHYDYPLSKGEPAGAGAQARYRRDIEFMFQGGPK